MFPSSPLRTLGVLCLLLLPWAAVHARAPEPAVCADLPWAAEARAGQLEAIPAGVGRDLAGGGRIGSVEFRREPIFDVSDPAQDNPLFRLANGLHILSREQTVLEQVPFLQPGEEVLPLELVEAERILRDVDWFFDARVVPVRRCGEEVDLVVVTRDVWTILPTVEFDSTGGESSFAIGVEDENLFGRGETLGFMFEDA
jgi:hypothetical protein